PDFKTAIIVFIAAPDHCFHRGAEIKDTTKALHVIVIESHSGRLGSAHLHCHRTAPRLSRYRQTIEWDGTIGNLQRVKALHRRLAAANKASRGSLPLMLT